MRWSEISKLGPGKIDVGNSGVIEGASHNLSGSPDEVVRALVEKVLGFLSGFSAQANL